ncbi:MAG: ABC transporter permease [Akkermansia sp.]|uniref:Transport permease protein n=2 Tax=Akkermansiaceae TaxID=1647988 RepID=A0ABM7ZDT7_9BACT|nr:ABC transporter permease [Akkermansia sp.]BDL42835.1 antibiotic ABC transporter permease [Akkermansia biwaensis]
MNNAMDFFIRLTSLIKKELLAVLRDKKSRLALIIPPVLQICIFGYAATMNVTRVPYAVLDKDGGELAAQYIADLEGTGIFRRQATAATEKDIDSLIDSRDIVLGLTIPPDFSRNLQTGRPASLQLIGDGRNTNTAAIALSYAQQIASNFGAELLAKNAAAPPVEIESRAWFNPNLITRWFIVPGLIAVLALIGSVLSGALSIAREREEGTFDQLLVAPYTPREILLGKGISTVITSIMQTFFIVLVAMFWFRIPFQGSIWLLSGAILLFIITGAAIGLCISSFSQSLQQAIVGTFLLVVPTVMLSGFATPISSMPEFFQDLTLLNPMRYGLELIQRIFLEGAGFMDLWPLFGAITLVTIGTAAAAIFSFHRKIS